MTTDKRKEQNRKAQATFRAKKKAFVEDLIKAKAALEAKLKEQEDN